MKQRAGYRADKKEDVARAKELLAQAGVDPKSTNVVIVGISSSFAMAEVADNNLRDLGFKVHLMPVTSSTDLEARKRKGDFDLEIPQIAPASFDDPMDNLADWYRTGGLRNYGQWTDPDLDRMFLEQDRTLDSAKRKELVLALQERVLQTRWVVPLNWRVSFGGHLPWAKNYPIKLPFLFQQRYRHEQVWLDR